MSQPTVARTGRRDHLLRREAYASAVDPRRSQLAYSGLNSTSLCKRANDLSQLATIGIP
jgi:hypothetical protein